MLLDWSGFICGGKISDRASFNSIDKRHRKMQKLMSGQFRLERDGRYLSGGFRGCFIILFLKVLLFTIYLMAADC